ncbi:glycolate oxidase subunit GlcF [Ramlibacter sp. Leaf400]|uniref:glycolate oxidase subunit GlcF n=1 Tax=Ramlibacter sp. Leaf400 TaxID=1736365 RepID=UPI0006F6FD0E|nr:glycolate oxidase subunit GlcF [Ramlibacter sp. Leaf400]KQT12238.1 glycolate oxidase iron-sulfur subunit [Ramlibacter sp. Leaf400]
MQTHLSPEFAGTPEGAEAEAILRKCVHCGFCTATCPTYQLLGDELDGPRGRIYLIKQVLEGEQPTEKTQLHLDRCLTCRNCESTCPSGVQYGHLVDIGRRIVEGKVPRGAGSKALRWALKEGLTSPAFGPAMKLGQAVRGLLPGALKAKVPASRPGGEWPTRTHARKVLLLEGCVQPSMAPNINAATARVLDAAGIQSLVSPRAGCCGAVKFHLNDQEGGLAQMRRNIDAWWPHVERNEVEALVMNASGCGVTVREYGHHLKHDPRYAQKAARISELTRDLSELLPELVPALQARVKAPAGVLAYHPPCTLQHGQQLRGGVETNLRRLGFDVQVALNESHLCCGSAGTYSVLQPEIATQLRDRKLDHLGALQPAAVLSANIGCITHLQSGTALPVRHWVEVLDESLRTD